MSESRESPVPPLRAATTIASTGARNKNTIKYKVRPRTARVQGGIRSFSARYFGVSCYRVPCDRRESKGHTGYGIKHAFYCRFVVFNVRVIFARCLPSRKGYRDGHRSKIIVFPGNRWKYVRNPKCPLSKTNPGACFSIAPFPVNGCWWWWFYFPFRRITNTWKAYLKNDPWKTRRHPVHSRSDWR